MGQVMENQKNDNRKLGDVLREWREVNDMSIAKASSVLGESEVRLQAIEGSQLLPAPVTLMRLAKSYSLPSSDLIEAIHAAWPQPRLQDAAGRA